MYKNRYAYPIQKLITGNPAEVDGMLESPWPNRDEPKSDLVDSLTFEVFECDPDSSYPLYNAESRRTRPCRWFSISPVSSYA